MKTAITDIQVCSCQVAMTPLCRLAFVLIFHLLVGVPLCCGNDALATASQQSPMVTNIIRRRPRLPNKTPASPSLSPPPSQPQPHEEAAMLQGELDVLVGNETSYTILRDSHSGEVTSVQLNEDNVVQYSGYVIRVRRTEPATPPPPPFQVLSSGDGSNVLIGKDMGPSSATTKPIRVSLEDVLGPADPGGAAKDGIFEFKITSVVFLLSFCNWRCPWDVAGFRNMWVNSPTTPRTARTMENYVAFCSQGAAQLTQQTQMIFEVPLPCDGTYKGKPFNGAKACSEAELYTWMNLAEEYVQTTLRQNISSIKQRIAVLPMEAIRNCPWGGLANVGCTGTRCYTWINGVYSGDLPTYMHEMGHNMGLQHSGRAGVANEYADTTCTLGTGRTCFNTANMWRVGWVAPLPGADLNALSMEVGRWRRLTLPSQNQAPQSYIRVNPTWAITGLERNSITSAPVPVYYISLRTPEAPFEILNSMSSNRVHVYSSYATQAANSFIKSILEAVLGPDITEFRAPLPYGLVVRVASVQTLTGGKMSAIVTLCRAGGLREAQGGTSCADGRDNDCDGLIDADDPDCVGVLAQPWSPPLRPIRSPPPTPTPPPPSIPPARRSSPPPPSPSRPPPRSPPRRPPPQPLPPPPPRPSPLPPLPEPPSPPLRRKLAPQRSPPTPPPPPPPPTPLPPTPLPPPPPQLLHPLPVSSPILPPSSPPHSPPSSTTPSPLPPPLPSLFGRLPPASPAPSELSSMTNPLTARRPRRAPPAPRPPPPQKRIRRLRSPQPPVRA